MSKLWIKLLMSFGMVFAGVLISENANAFTIYATEVTETTITGISNYSPPPLARTSDSLNISANGDGTYKLDKQGFFEDLNHGIQLDIKNKKLIIKVGGGLYCQPGKTAEIAFQEDVKAFRDAIQSAIGGKTWAYTCNIPSEYSATIMDIKVTFDVMDVTDKDRADANTEEAQEEIDQELAASEVEPTCMNSGAGESMGWILCPILDIVSDTTQFLYNDFVEPALKVEPKLFSQSEDNGTRYAWGVFQGVANTIFIILLLVVIFSQLTGVGIDNYGIKKILPKLITAAILINLSYIICLIFVDVSNILGNGLKAFFDNLPIANFTAGDNIDVPMGNGKVTLESVGIGTGVAVGLLAAVATQIWPLYASGGFVGILLALLTVAISVFIAIAFIFLLLAAREAAIIVLVVISPLAFACYILPNTKKLFDRWLGAGKALLLLYPICGLLMGGGNFVSRLLLTTNMTDGFFTALMAMIMGIVPLFFIPSLLKNSLNALGNIGAKISGAGKSLGGRLSSGADSSIRGSNRFKSHQFELERKRQGRNAMRVSKSRFSSPLEKARAQETLDKMKREDYAAQAILTEKELENEFRGVGGLDMERWKEKWESAYVKGDGEKLRALTTVGQKKFGSGAANSIGEIMAENSLTKDGMVDRNIQNSLATLNDMQTHDSAFNGLMSSKASDAYDMISRMGQDRVKVIDENGKEVEKIGTFNLDHFSGGEHGGANATKSTDFATQSSGTLKRMVANDGISDDVLQELAYGDTETMRAFQSDASKMEVVRNAIQDRQTRGVWAPSNPDPRVGGGIATTA